MSYLAIYSMKIVLNIYLVDTNLVLCFAKMYGIKTTALCTEVSLVFTAYSAATMWPVH